MIDSNRRKTGRPDNLSDNREKKSSTHVKSRVIGPGRRVNYKRDEILKSCTSAHLQISILTRAISLICSNTSDK